MIDSSLKKQGLKPSDYYISAIGAGAEMWDATFSLTGYSLSMTPAVAVTPEQARVKRG